MALTAIAPEPIAACTLEDLAKEKNKSEEESSSKEVSGSCACCVKCPSYIGVCCKWFCNVSNPVGCVCSDKNRKALIMLTAILFLVAIPCGIIGVMGLSSISGIMKALYWMKYESAGSTSIIYTNLYGVIQECTTATCVYTSPTSWDTYTTSIYADKQGKDCADSAVALKMIVVFAGIVGTLFPLLNAIAGQRSLREKDRYFKCNAVISFLLPVIFNVSALIAFPEKCGIEPAGTTTTFGPGYWCLVVVVFVNVPAFIIHAIIPAPDPDNDDCFRGDSDYESSNHPGVESELKISDEPPQAIVIE